MLTTWLSADINKIPNYASHYIGMCKRKEREERCDERRKRERGEEREEREGEERGGES
jgi:hypothetical protein